MLELLVDFRPEDLQELVAVQLYTDGSGGSEGGGGAAEAAPSWAVLVIGVLRGGRRCILGAAACALPGHAQDAGDGGEPAIVAYNLLAGRARATSFAAELFASLWALLWAVDFLAAFPELKPAVALSADAEVVIAIAGGAAGSNAEPGLPAAVRNAELELRGAAGGALRLHHVFSHVGHPFNELVDSLATAAGQGMVRSADLPPRLPRFLEENVADWSWLRCAGADELAALPPLVDGAFVFSDRRAAVEPCDTVRVAGLQRVPGWAPAPADVVGFRLATANIMSALPAEGADGAAVGRLALLARQFAGARFDVVGEQESRLQPSTPIRTHGYRILQAAADEAANYGVQLWVAEGGPVKFAGLQVVGQGPRHLIVASAVPACHFVVAHAPSAANGNLMELAALRGFWDKVSDALVAGAAVKIVLLADANAVVGSVPSDAIGTVRADVESQAGAVFHRWLQRWRVCLPPTFVEGRGDGATWTPPGGGPRRRIDFVGVPLDWLHLVVEAEVDQS